jgi:hypothetical protein
MQVAQWAGRKSATVAHLPPSVLYVISTPNAPEEFVHEVIQRIEAGEHVEPRTLRAELRARRALHRQDRRNNVHCDGAIDSRMAPEPTASAAKSRNNPVLEVLIILARELPGNTFQQVRSILTSEGVVCTEPLSKYIASALAVIDRSAQEPESPPPFDAAELR